MERLGNAQCHVRNYSDTDGKIQKACSKHIYFSYSSGEKVGKTRACRGRCGYDQAANLATQGRIKIPPTLQFGASQTKASLQKLCAVTIFSGGGSVTKWSARRTRNQAVVGPGFRSGHMLDVFPVVPSSNPWSRL